MVDDLPIWLVTLVFGRDLGVWCATLVVTGLQVGAYPAVYHLDRERLM